MKQTLVALIVLLSATMVDCATSDSDAGADWGARADVAFDDNDTAVATDAVREEPSAGDAITEDSTDDGTSDNGDPTPVRDSGPIDPGETHPSILTMERNTFLEVPDSALESVCACANGFPEVCGVEHCETGPVSYSGAELDDNRSRLILWGGGHNAYYGNEIYVFDMSTLSWERLTDPGPAGEEESCVETLSDGTPNSRHTYDGMIYLSAVDQLFTTGGSLACKAGSGSDLYWLFDFATETWQEIDLELVDSSESPHIHFAYNYASAYDPSTGLGLLETTNGLYEVDHADGTITRLNNTYDGAGGRWLERTGVIVPDRRLFVSVGSGTVWAYSLSDGSWEQWTTSGDKAVEDASAPGVAYDPRSGQIYGWAGRGEVLRLDLDQRRWIGTGTSWTPAQPLGWTWGRWAYVPRDDVFIAVSRGDENVHIYKP